MKLEMINQIEKLLEMAKSSTHVDYSIPCNGQHGHILTIHGGCGLSLVLIQMLGIPKDGSLKKVGDCWVVDTFTGIKFLSDRRDWPEEVELEETREAINSM